VPFPPRVVDLHTNACRLDICHNDPQERPGEPLIGYAVGDLAVGLLTVYNHIKLEVDLQVDKSPVVVKGPSFTRVVNPTYRKSVEQCVTQELIY
jgi:hypothetical protein